MGQKVWQIRLLQIEEVNIGNDKIIISSYASEDEIYKPLSQNIENETLACTRIDNENFSGWWLYTNNLGDHASIQVLLKDLKKSVPDVEAVVLSRHPEENFLDNFNVKLIKNLDHLSKN